VPGSVATLEYTEAVARDGFVGRGAIREGHFKLSSGMHSPVYVQCQTVLAYPDEAERICRALAERFLGLKVAAVVGPATGGIVIAHEVARTLGARSLFAERDAGKFDLRRGQALEAGERVLLVENVVTTGGSVNEVVDLVRAKGGVPVGVATLVNRLASGHNPFGSLRFEWLVRADAPAFAPAECPLCAEGRPLESPGSRHLKPAS
jgi:orotate phosphoribosyltransferase